MSTESTNTTFSAAKALQEMRDLLDSVEEQAAKFDGGVGFASVKVRAAMQDLVQMAKAVRADVQATKNARRAPEPAADAEECACGAAPEGFAACEG